MIVRLLRSGGSLLVYLGLATLLSQGILLSYVTLAWGINRTKLVQALAILQDVDLFAIKEAAEGEQEEVSLEQASYDQIIERRAIKVHHLELREQALRDGLNMLRFEQRKLAEERKRYKQLRGSFDKQLADMQEQITSEGMDDNRRKLEAIKAKQAKELLTEMLDQDEINDVVTLLKGMPDVKAAKIISEFKTDEELEKIGKVLRLIRQGTPLSDLVADTRKKLDQSKPTGP